MTDIDENWIKSRVGKGKRFSTLDELLVELKEIRRMFGPSCGFAGGPIDLEISIIEEMIEKESESDVHGEGM